MLYEPTPGQHIVSVQAEGGMTVARGCGGERRGGPLFNGYEVRFARGEESWEWTARQREGAGHY